LEILAIENSYSTKIIALYLNLNNITKIAYLKYLSFFKKFNFDILPETCKVVNIANNKLTEDNIYHLNLENNNFSLLLFVKFPKLTFCNISSNRIIKLENIIVYNLKYLKCKNCHNLIKYDDIEFSNINKVKLSNCGLEHTYLK
jgi:hypothetical protein